MPSIMTLEGPKLGCGPCTASGGAVGSTTAPTGMRLALFAIGGAALLGVAYLFVRGDRRRSLRGPEMLKIIASEARTPEEFARRAEAWNAAERSPLPVTKLAKAYRKAKPATVARLIRDAREQREEGRERLWTKMSLGLRGLDGYRVVYGSNDGKKTFGVLDENTFETVEGAIKRRRFYKNRGMTAWIEDEEGNFVPVPGAKSASVRKSFPR